MSATEFVKTKCAFSDCTNAPHWVTCDDHWGEVPYAIREYAYSTYDIWETTLEGSIEYTKALEAFQKSQEDARTWLNWGNDVKTPSV